MSGRNTTAKAASSKGAASAAAAGGTAGIDATATPAAPPFIPAEVSAAAIRSAREEVKSKFRSSADLARLPAFLAECAVKRATIEAQLSSGVRTQVDETRLGLQLLQDAAAMMAKMRSNFLAIDQYCKDCKMVLRDSPEIQRVNTARKNLDATTRLLDKFRSLPEQAESLLEELDSTDRAIKGVYKRMRILFRLRDSAMDQPGGGGAALPGGTGGFSADFLSQLHENFEELQSAANAVEERIWENIADAALLAKDDPITLVRTLEVIEMEDRASRKVFGPPPLTPQAKAAQLAAQKKKKGASSAAATSEEEDLSSPAAVAAAAVRGSTSVNAMREKCFAVLEKSITDQFNHLHIDEETARRQEREKAKEEKKKQAQLEMHKARLRKEEAERKKAARLKRIENGEESAGEDDEQEDVDEPEDNFSPSPPKKPGGGLYHNDEDEEDVDEDLEAEMDGAMGKKGGPSDFILTILEEMTDLVETLPLLLNSLVPIFPPHYALPLFYIERYVRFLKSTLIFHTGEPKKLSKKAQLKAVNWLEWFRNELKKWETMYPETKQLIQNLCKEGSAAEMQEKQMKQLLQKKKQSQQKQKQRKRSEDEEDETKTGDEHDEDEADEEEEDESASSAAAANAGPSSYSFLDDLVRSLMKCYTESTTDTLTRLCDNILSADEKAEAELDASTGQYRTSAPSDLFYTMNSTLEIVLASFGTAPLPLASVCLMVADIFTYYQNVQLSFLQFVELEEDSLYFGQQRILKHDTYFCAVINNCSASQEHMDDLKDKILDRLRTADGIDTTPPLPTKQSKDAAAAGYAPATLMEQLENTFEECGEGFVSVASEATDLLVLQVTATLQKPCGNLFSPSWLKDESVTDDILLTLKDFAQDYQVWIGRDAYFSRVMIRVLQSVVQEYLRKLIEVKPQVSTQLFERIKLDKHLLYDFFKRYARPESADDAGGEDGGEDAGADEEVGSVAKVIPMSTLKSELRQLTLINKIVHQDPDFMSVHFDKLIARFGHGAKEVMEGLLAMRSDVKKEQKKEIMAKFAEKLPPPDAAQLLERQLVSQNVAALASPKGKKKPAAAADESAGKSFWDRFKSRGNKAEQKAKPSAALLPAHKRSADEGQSLTDFLAD